MSMKADLIEVARRAREDFENRKRRAERLLGDRNVKR